MHKLDITMYSTYRSYKSLMRDINFGWELIGSVADNARDNKVTEYGYDRMSGSVVSRERKLFWYQYVLLLPDFRGIHSR